MSRANDNSLIPVSLAASGTQRAVAKADGQCMAERSALALIRHGLAVALYGCEALHVLTDDPLPGVVETADCIEAAADHLASACCRPQAKANEGSDRHRAAS